MLTGEAMLHLKHTLTVRERFIDMCSTMAGRAGSTAKMLADRQDRWSEVDCSDDLFYAYVGLLLGRKAVAPRIAASALKYWDAAREAHRNGTGDLVTHAAHGAPNLLSAFQAVSGGMARSAPRRVFETYAATDFITEGIAQSGGSLEGVPAFTFEIEDF